MKEGISYGHKDQSTFAAFCHLQTHPYRVSATDYFLHYDFMGLYLFTGFYLTSTL